MRQPLRPQKAYEGSEIKVVFSQHVTEGWVEEKFKIRYHGHSNKNVLVILVLYFFLLSIYADVVDLPAGPATAPPALCFASLPGPETSFFGV